MHGTSDKDVNLFVLIKILMLVFSWLVMKTVVSGDVIPFWDWIRNISS
jgi:hypothetical protein